MDHHASARWPEFSSPFSAVCGAMGTHCGAIDAQIIARVRLYRERREDPPPETAMALAVEPVGDGRRRAITGRAILPATPDPQEMLDAADHPAVIHRPRAGLVLGQKRLNRRPGPVRKPKSIRHHHIQSRLAEVNQMICT